MVDSGQLEPALSHQKRALDLLTDHLPADDPKIWDARELIATSLAGMSGNSRVTAEYAGSMQSQSWKPAAERVIRAPTKGLPCLKRGGAYSMRLLLLGLQLRKSIALKQQLKRGMYFRMRYGAASERNLHFTTTGTHTALEAIITMATNASSAATSCTWTSSAIRTTALQLA